MWNKYAGVLIVGMLLSSCAAHYSGDSVLDPYGFFSGLWHGFVFLFAVVANILSWLLGLVGISFLDSVQIVGRPNTGFFYYVGFFLGLCSAGGGASRR